ncbi:MAG: hypothetical protein QOI09_1829, partial [Chloroflexota bacterium]|nr:hypothetical protein [Chloroflexota bacterium]
MTDDRDELTKPEIVDLPSPRSRDRGGSVTVPPDDASSRGTGRLALPGRRRPPIRTGDGRQIVCEGLVRIYKVADLEVVALQGLDLVVGTGEMVAIVGASGSGKSTLLNILGGLDTPSAGRAVVAGHDLGQ